MALHVQGDERSMSVRKLLVTPFLYREHEDKIRILTSGKPRPFLSKKISERGLILNEFDPSIYDQIEWLTGCETTQKFVCWPCLLYRSTEKWSVPNSDLVFIHQYLKRHEKSTQHMDSVFKMRIFIMQNISKSNSFSNKIQRSEYLKRNRESMKLLIDVICLASRNASRTDEYECNILKVEDCVKCLQLLKNCSRLKIDLIDDSIGFLNKFPRILNNLVDAITHVLKVAVANEIRNCRYASVILNEYLTNNKKYQVSTILRYIKDGKVCERFIGFTNLVGNKLRSNSLANHALNIIKDYGISEKIVAFSVDGTVLPQCDVKELVQLMESRFKFCYFLPYTGFGYVLLQSLRVLKECNLFLKVLNGIESYLKNVQRFSKFEAYLITRVPNLKTKRWYTTSPFITFLSIYRKRFVEFFDMVVKNSETWPADDVVQAEAFRDHLQQLHTIFLLKTFNAIFADHFDENFNFKTETSLGIFCEERVKKFCTGIRKLSGFSGVWNDLTVDFIEANSSDSDLRNDHVKSVYVGLYEKIVEHLVEEVNIRCKDIKKLKFCGMLNCNHQGVPNFKNSLRLEMQQEHSSLFDDNELNSEIIVFKGNPSLFSNKSAYELLETFTEYNFRDVFTQICKLTEFALTLPIVPASEQKRTSKLNSIKDYSYVPKINVIPSGEMSVLCLETEMLRDLKCSESFHDRVLAELSKVTKDVEF